MMEVLAILLFVSVLTNIMLATFWAVDVSNERQDAAYWKSEFKRIGDAWQSCHDKLDQFHKATIEIGWVKKPKDRQ